MNVNVEANMNLKMISRINQSTNFQKLIILFSFFFFYNWKSAFDPTRAFYAISIFRTFKTLGQFEIKNDLVYVNDKMS